MFEAFELLAKQFSDLMQDFNSSRDPETRKELLIKMRLIVDEADSLHKLHGNTPPQQKAASSGE